ncbi:PorV/PorQ family protein [candidate division WOR-3 bacterium]|nr:PorV/PorQ family protein [candidate division WOR-3 bacterium]
MKRIFAFLLILLLTSYFLLPTSLYAGSYGAELLSLGVGGRAIGMGSAYTAIANDGFSPLWNPAGIVKNKGFFMSSMHASPFGLENFDFIGVGKPGTRTLQNSFFEISFLRLAIDSIPKFSEDYKIIDFFTNREEVFLFSYAYKYHPHLGIGLNIKYLRHTLYNKFAWGGGLDLGIIYERERLSFGLVVKDIGGTHIIWDTGHKDSRPTNLTFGVAYCLPADKSGWKNFIVSSDLGYEYKFLYRLGLEYLLKNLLFLRIGWKDNFTAGVGCQPSAVGCQLSFDYAYSFHELGNTHHISFSLKPF